MEMPLGEAPLTGKTGERFTIRMRPIRWAKVTVAAKIIHHFKIGNSLIWNSPDGHCNVLTNSILR